MRDAARAAANSRLTIAATMVAIAVGVGMLAVSPLIKRLMHLETLRDHAVDHAMAGEWELAEPSAPGLVTEGELKPGDTRS
jgi:hypothetical protein